MVGITVMALLYLYHHHNGRHHDGTAVPTLSPWWASLQWHFCTSTITVMGTTAVAPLCQHCHCNGVTTMAPPYLYHHHNGHHRDGTAVPTLSLQWGHHDGTTVPLPSL